MPNLEKLVERLVEHQVEFVIVGGYAAMIYGVSYITFDVNVCGPLNPENLTRLHTAVADLHPYHRMTPNEIPFVLSEGPEREWKNLYLKTDFGQLDFLGSLPDVGDFAFAREHSTLMKLSFGECRLLDIPTLIHAKKNGGPPEGFARCYRIARHPRRHPITVLTRHDQSHRSRLLGLPRHRPCPRPGLLRRGARAGGHDHLESAVDRI